MNPPPPPDPVPHATEGVTCRRWVRTVPSRAGGVGGVSGGSVRVGVPRPTAPSAPTVAWADGTLVDALVGALSPAVGAGGAERS